MSQQIGSSHIDELDDAELTDQVLQELDEAIDDDADSSTGEVKVITSKRTSGTLFDKKLFKNGIDAFIVLILTLIVSNKYTLHMLFKLPFLRSFTDHAFIPVTLVAFLISILFFIIKFFV